MLARLLNACHHFPGFVYAAVRLIEATSSIEVDVRPRRGSKARCSCCGKPAPGYDVLPVRRFEFIPIWGYAVMLLYAMRRVQCRHCGVKVELVPWAVGKHSLTKAYMLYLAHLARSCRGRRRRRASAPPGIRSATRWSTLCSGGWRTASSGPCAPSASTRSTSARAAELLTLVYQIEADCVRLLWVGKDRTKQSFEGFFTRIGAQLAGKVEFVCSDMWRPYLEVIARHCPQALNILDRFHMVAKLNKVLDEVRAGEARQMIRQGYEPLLKNKRWCLLKRPENLTDKQRLSLRELLGYNLTSVRAYLLSRPPLGRASVARD